MISAGNSYQPQQTGYPQAGYQQQGYGSPYGYGGGPSFQPMGMAQYNPGVAISGPSISVETNPVDYKEVAPIMWGNVGVQGLAVLGGIISQKFQKDVAIKSMEVQLQLGQAYYATQDSIAGKQQTVALAQVGLQEKMIDAQVQMHAEQTDHEKAMLEQEGYNTARVVDLQEKWKTKRLEIASLNQGFDPFSRSGWHMGSPVS